MPVGATNHGEPCASVRGHPIDATPPHHRQLLASADSMSWSDHERRNGGDANDWEAAEQFRLRCDERAGFEDLPMWAA